MPNVATSTKLTDEGVSLQRFSVLNDVLAGAFAVLKLVEDSRLKGVILVLCVKTKNKKKY